MVNHENSSISMKLAFLGVVFVCLLAGLGCVDDDDNKEDVVDNKDTADPETSFLDAEVLDGDWCLEVQLELAALAGTEWTAEKIDVAKTETESEMSGFKSSINPESERPIGIVSYVGKMTNTIVAYASDRVG